MPAKAILQGVLADGGRSVGDVIAADDDRGFLTSAMWHLVWSGEIEMDLNVPWDQALATGVGQHNAVLS
ncbi:MAG: hypothetical protein V9G19_18280 [Tetrasphaera sp.]